MRRTVLAYLSKLDMKKLPTQMTLQCAPLLAGIKVSNLLIIPSTITEDVGSILKGTGISWLKLSEANGKASFLLYRHEQLTKWLGWERNRRFLSARTGWDACSFSDILMNMRGRYDRYVKGQGAFPHEIGLLLGYPPEDVMGFVVNRGKNYLCNGYWKVYANREQKEGIFETYDQVREGMIRRLAEGTSLEDMIVRTTPALPGLYAA